MRKISIDDLLEGMISNQTICNDRGIVLVAKGITLTNPMIKGLRKFNIGNIDVQEDFESTQSLSSSTSIALKTISTVIDLTDNVFDSRTINAKNNIGEIEKVMYSVLKRPFIQEFLKLCASNELLYKHSLRTAILSINMGLIQKWNFMNLELLAMCAILHDSGMEQEFDASDKEHPFLGFIKLRSDMDIDMLIAVVCLQHHENYDGSGFPYSFRRTQITEFACLLAIVDYYDRLLMMINDPRQALFETIGKKNTFFDPSLVDLFSSTIDWSRLYNIPINLS